MPSDLYTYLLQPPAATSRTNRQKPGDIKQAMLMLRSKGKKVHTIKSYILKQLTIPCVLSKFGT
jgi:hypothetical protein